MLSGAWLFFTHSRFGWEDGYRNEFIIHCRLWRAIHHHGRGDLLQVNALILFRYFIRGFNNWGWKSWPYFYLIYTRLNSEWNRMNGTFCTPNYHPNQVSIGNQIKFNAWHNRLALILHFFQAKIPGIILETVQTEELRILAWLEAGSKNRLSYQSAPFAAGGGRWWRLQTIKTFTVVYPVTRPGDKDEPSENERYNIPSGFSQNTPTHREAGGKLVWT